jgi:hypothetical protein
VKGLGHMAEGRVCWGGIGGEGDGNGYFPIPSVS